MIKLSSTAAMVLAWECGYAGWRIASEPTGDLAFTISADQNGAVFDVRVVVTRRRGGRT